MIKNKKNNNKGITLIALVVTIIVLLILAGITIATLTDNQNGIFSNAKKARSLNAIGEADERMRMAYTAVKTTISANVSSNSSYDATDSTEMEKLGRILATDLIKTVSETSGLSTQYGTEGTDDYIVKVDTTNKLFEMKNINSAIRSNDIKNLTISSPSKTYNANNGTFIGVITIGSDKQETTYYSQR